MKSKTKQIATSVTEVQITLVQMVCALRIKTGCEDDMQQVCRQNSTETETVRALWNDLLYIAMYTSFACNVAAIIRLICQ